MNLRIRYQSSPAADPHPVVLDGVCGQELVIVGGQTRLERHAAQILAGMAIEALDGASPGLLVRTALDMAAELERQLDARSGAASHKLPEITA